MRIAIALGLLLLAGCAQPTVQEAIIEGTSMEPLLIDGERTCVDLHAYDNTTPERDDLVMYDFPGGALVKRVAAVPDDAWTVENDALLINGEPATNSEGKTYRVIEREKKMLANYAQYNPLPAEHYILLSENPMAGKDSRSYGLANEEDIKGKVVPCG